LHLITAYEAVLLDTFAIDERPVRAIQIEDDVVVVNSADLRMMAGDFGVMELDRIGDIAPQPERRFG